MPYKDPNALKNYKKEWSKAYSQRPGYSEKLRAWKLKHKYNITIAEWEQMFVDQGGVCAICGNSPKTMHVDHDHITGRVRGILCGNCNRALGLFKEDSKLLHLAEEYLRRL